MTFNIVGASIPGSSHLGQGVILLGRNNQDAFSIYPRLGEDRIWRPGEKPLIGLVSDGVSSCITSEVGSQLAVRIVSAKLASEFSRVQIVLKARLEGGSPIDKDPLPLAFWRRFDANAYAPFSALLTMLSTSDAEFRQNMRELFIFTTLGILHTEEFGSWVFGPRGSDGVFAVNGEVTVLKPQSGNKPISPIYRFVPNEFQNQPELMDTIVHRYFLPGELQSFLIGTDGVEHLIKAEGKKIPGRKEKVRPLDDFWNDPEFLVDDTLLLYLRQLNTQWPKVMRPSDEQKAAGKECRLVIEPRLLLDDTTVIIGRRISDEGEGSLI